MGISSLFWLVVFNPLFHSVWSGQNFLSMFVLFFEIWMIPPVWPWSVPVIVGKKVEVLAGSGGLELVQGLLGELEPHALGWGRLFPFAQLGFLHVLVFPLTVRREDSLGMAMPVPVEVQKGDLATRPQHLGLEFWQ
ncbi:unnamed protein product [Prunus armeniaca]